jgi:hypothetical protein
MKNKLSLESFILTTNTKDGYQVVIGGICPKGLKDEAVKAYNGITYVEFGQFRDEYIIDHILADAITKLSPHWICIVGASIFIDGITNSTGGVIGKPFEEHGSSQEEIEKIDDELYMISFSGGPGIVYKGTYSEGILLKDMVLSYKADQTKSIKELVFILDKITNLYIIVMDGSGNLNRGGIFVSDYKGKKFETLSL